MGCDSCGGGGPCGCWGDSPPTSTRVDIATPSNTTFQDAFQFDPIGPTGCPAPLFSPCGQTGPNWTLQNQNFNFDVKTDINSASLTAQFTSSNNQIIVVDAIQRIIEMNVSAATMGLLVPATYIYQLTMFDNSVPPVVLQLMYGHLVVKPGF